MSLSSIDDGNFIGDDREASITAESAAEENSHRARENGSNGPSDNSSLRCLLCRATETVDGRKRGLILLEGSIFDIRSDERENVHIELKSVTESMRLMFSARTCRWHNRIQWNTCC